MCVSIGVLSRRRIYDRQRQAAELLHIPLLPETHTSELPASGEEDTGWSGAKALARSLRSPEMAMGCDRRLLNDRLSLGSGHPAEAGSMGGGSPCIISLSAAAAAETPELLMTTMVSKPCEDHMIC